MELNNARCINTFAPIVFLHLLLVSNWQLLEWIIIEEKKLNMCFQKAKRRRRTRPRGKKEQLMWKKLGYHGNFFWVQRKLVSSRNRVSKFVPQHLTKCNIAARGVEKTEWRAWIEESWKVKREQVGSDSIVQDDTRLFLNFFTHWFKEITNVHTVYTPPTCDIFTTSSILYPFCLLPFFPGTHFKASNKLSWTCCIQSLAHVYSKWREQQPLFFPSRYLIIIILKIRWALLKWSLFENKIEPIIMGF